MQRKAIYTLRYVKRHALNTQAQMGGREPNKYSLPLGQ